MKNGIKSTQELIMHLFQKKNPFKKEINNKNTNLLLNHKNNNIFNQSLTNRAKYKTSKNSPENIINSKIQKNIINKMILSGQKKDEIIKKKIQHIKEKRVVPKSNNNSISMNITNNIYQNYINNIYIKNKNIFINKINFKKNKNNNQNITKKNNSNNNKKAYTSRGSDLTKRANSNYDLKKKSKNINSINNNEDILKKSGSKYLNLINQYIASVSAVSKQPHRPNNQKNRFMTINAKKVKDIYKQNSMSNSQIYKKLGITMENTNLENINNINNLNQIKNSINNIYNNINQNNNIKNNFIFSSTSNSLNKKSKKSNQKSSNFHFELRKINRTTYQNKQQNRIHSLEKSLNNNNINHSSINRKINSIAFIKNFNSPSITMYNKQNSEIMNKNLLNINNNINKYLFNGVNHIVDLKRKSVEKSINHLYKQKQKPKDKKFNYLISLKEVKDNMSLIGMNYINNINNLNKKNKSSLSINFAKDKIKDNKDNNIITNQNKQKEKEKENITINKKKDDNLNVNIKKEKTEKEYISDKVSKDSKKEIDNDNKKEISNNNDNSINKENKKEKNKIIRDKDLSCTENAEDSLLDYLNKNIDYHQNEIINTEISESNESLLSFINTVAF